MWVANLFYDVIYTGMGSCVVLEIAIRMDRHLEIACFLTGKKKVSW